MLMVPDIDFFAPDATAPHSHAVNEVTDAHSARYLEVPAEHIRSADMIEKDVSVADPVYDLVMRQIAVLVIHICHSDLEEYHTPQLTHSADVPHTAGHRSSLMS